MYRLIIEHIVKQVFREVHTPTKAKQELLSSKEHGGKFLPLSDPYRVGNPGDITDKEFRKILKSVFKIKSEDIDPIKPGPDSPSSKFMSYRFPYKGKMTTLILAGKGKEKIERQERGLIAAINSIEGDKTLVFKNKTLKGVTEINKATQKGERYAAQPYADLDLVVQGKTVKISAKGFDSPSLGSGGLTGLDNINNPTVNSFIEKAYRDLAADYQKIINSDPRLKGRDLKGNKLFGDYYAAIPLEAEIPILRGTEDMGGPIDYMYIGSMDVGIEVEGNTINIDGYLYTLEEFVKQGTPLYIRIAKRKGPCYFTTEKNTKLRNIDVPKIFAIKPDGSGGSQSRLFVTNRATKKKDYQS